MRASACASSGTAALDAAARRRGIGRTIVEGIARSASERGALLLRLGVTEPATDVAAFYEHLGFIRTEETKLLPRHGEVRAFFLVRQL